MAFSTQASSSSVQHFQEKKPQNARLATSTSHRRTAFTRGGSRPTTASIADMAAPRLDRGAPT